MKPRSRLVHDVVVVAFALVPALSSADVQESARRQGAQTQALHQQGMFVIPQGQPGSLYSTAPEPTSQYIDRGPGATMQSTSAPFVSDLDAIEPEAPVYEQAPPLPPGASTPLTSHVVRERFSHTLGGGCIYSTSVRGWLRDAHRPGERDLPSGPMAADLRVSTSLRCPGGRVERRPIARVRTGSLLPGEIERLLEDRAALRVRRDGHVCIYSPDFRVGHDAVTTRGVTVACGAIEPAPTAGRGGGPSSLARPGRARPNIPDDEVQTPDNTRSDTLDE